MADNMVFVHRDGNHTGLPLFASGNSTECCSSETRVITVSSNANTEMSVKCQIRAGIFTSFGSISTL